MIQICSGITSDRVLNGEFYAQRLQKLIYHTIHMYSGITSGRVLNGELLYTKILEVN